MLEKNIILNFYQKAFVVTILFCVAGAYGSMAQHRDVERNMPEVRVDDNIPHMESPEAGNTDYSSNFKRPADNKSTSKDKLQNSQHSNNPLYRQGGDKDVAKRENVSTLSFNLFLYIVDKFKED